MSKIPQNMLGLTGASAAASLLPILELDSPVTLTSAGGAFLTTTTVYPAGTYLVGMTTTASGTFVTSDYIQFRIIDTGLTATLNPDSSPALVNLIPGNQSFGTVVGILKFPTAGTIQFRVSGSFTNPGTVSLIAEGGWIQRIA